MTDQLPYWIALSKVPGIGPARMRLLLLLRHPPGRLERPSR
jgi:hypothetical protein